MAELSKTSRIVLILSSVLMWTVELVAVIFPQDLPDLRKDDSTGYRTIKRSDSANIDLPMWIPKRSTFGIATSVQSGDPTSTNIQSPRSRWVMPTFHALFSELRSYPYDS